MAVADIIDWIDEFAVPGHIWYAKRLSGNDTLANGAHQGGPYVPKSLLFRLFPAVHRPELENPDINFDMYIDSHADYRSARGVWYNKKLHGKGTRNEARFTGFGGASSALLDPDSTGALAIFVFVLADDGTAVKSHAWICRHATEEDLFEDRIGPVEPKQMVVWVPGAGIASSLFAKAPSTKTSCYLDETEIPPDWLVNFPSGETIIRKTVQFRPSKGIDPDARLMRRRKCEYEIFQSVEKAFFMPRIRNGSFETIESFIGLAQSILQSRKARSGNSLEFHAREILIEEGFVPGDDFCHRAKVESGKRPDFIFPSQAAYDDASFPKAKLRMLAAKTTCKDRWRQVINEANRISVKHLLTLQEGVSENQFAEMREEGVQLVVPAGLHSAYSEAVRPHLISFESFIADVRLLSLA